MTGVCRLYGTTSDYPPRILLLNRQSPRPSFYGVCVFFMFPLPRYIVTSIKTLHYLFGLEWVGHFPDDKINGGFEQPWVSRLEAKKKNLQIVQRLMGLWDFEVLCIRFSSEYIPAPYVF